MRSTIVGVATGTPDGGVAVIRLSGARAIEIARALAGELGAPRTLARRGLALGDAEEDARQDARQGPAGERRAAAREDALVAVMPGPHSFTGEDVVELHVHGGAVNVAEVMRACLRHGALAAEAGDFSRRAFEHGRLTLAQSEGIAALIGAKTRAGAAQARRLVAGELGEQVRACAELVARLRVEVEAYLDFPDDVDPSITVDWAHRVAELGVTIERWLGSFEAGRRAREIPRVVLAGPPNAGKSSLLNALLGTRRALVADGPGTTRDFVEARLDLGRHAIVLVDTAGLREASPDAIERAGIELSKAQLAGADLLLWLCPCDVAEVTPAPAQARDAAAVWELRSKADLGGAVGVKSGDAADALAGRTAQRVCAQDPISVDALRSRLSAWVQGHGASAWVGLARHRDRAQEAGAALAEARELLSGDAQVELVAFALQVAQVRLEEIDGRSRLGPVGADVLDAIFSSFCIGK